MLLGMSTGPHHQISVQDIGLASRTAADGLAVRRPSAFAGQAVRELVSGIFIIRDGVLFDYLRALWDSESFFIESSACAAFHGAVRLGSMEHFLCAGGLTEKLLQNSCRIVWATGGSLVPEAERRRYLNAGLRYCGVKSSPAAPAVPGNRQPGQAVRPPWALTIRPRPTRFFRQILRGEKYEMLQSERLIYRKISEDDFEVIAKIMRDPGVRRVWGHFFTDGDVRDWIVRRQAGYRSNGIDYLLAIRKTTREAVGQIGLLREQIAGEEVWGIGYLLLSRFRGSGYAAEGARAMMDYAFHTLHALKIVCDIRPANTPSIAVAKRIGMTEAGSFVKIYRGIEMPHLIFQRLRGPA